MLYILVPKAVNLDYRLTTLLKTLKENTALQWCGCRHIWPNHVEILCLFVNALFSFVLALISHRFGRKIGFDFPNMVWTLAHFFV